MNTIEMAKAAGATGTIDGCQIAFTHDEFQNFTDAIRKAERERCADVIAFVAERISAQVKNAENGYVLKTVVVIEEAIKELNND